MRIRGKIDVVLGSAAFLASFREIGEKGPPLEATLDADFVLEPINSDLADFLRDAIGEPGILYEKIGCGADCLRPEIVETFPAGWESRLVPLADYGDVSCLDPYDVALVKLGLGHKKDLSLVQSLVRMGKARCFAVGSSLPRDAACRAGHRFAPDGIYRPSRMAAVPVNARSHPETAAAASEGSGLDRGDLPRKTTETRG